MRTKAVLLIIAGILFFLGLWVKHARGEDSPPRQAYLGVNVKKDSTMVVNVLPDSPAHKAGIRPGDVITSLHGETITNDIELLNIMLSRRPGEKVSIAVLRTPTQGLAFNVTLVEHTQEVFKSLASYDVLEWRGPDDPRYWKFGGGLITVYYFTATWCAPCKELRPHIEKVYRQFKNNPDVRFVAVAISDDKNDRDEYKALVKLQKQGHYPFTIMRDSTIWENNQSGKVPTVLIVNQRGFIVGEYHGIDLLPDKCATLLKGINLLIDNPSPYKLTWL